MLSVAILRLKIGDNISLKAGVTFIDYLPNLFTEKLFIMYCGFCLVFIHLVRTQILLKY